jgi:hypothetical protein
MITSALLALSLASACQRTPSATVVPASEPAAAAAQPEAPAGAPGLDKRTPVPLTAMMATHQKQEMRDHLRVVQEISAALGKDDFEAVAVAAGRIGWSEQQAAMCKHMGAGAPGFSDMGEHFHKTADGISAAAREHDRAAVMVALSQTLDTCVGCHETYRQEIVDDTAFKKVGGGMGASMDCPMMK